MHSGPPAPTKRRTPTASVPLQAPPRRRCACARRDHGSSRLPLPPCPGPGSRRPAPVLLRVHGVLVLLLVEETELEVVAHQDLGPAGNPGGEAVDGVHGAAAGLEALPPAGQVLGIHAQGPGQAAPGEAAGLLQALQALGEVPAGRRGGVRNFLSSGLTAEKSELLWLMPEGLPHLPVPCPHLRTGQNPRPSGASPRLGIHRLHHPPAGVGVFSFLTALMFQPGRPRGPRLRGVQG